MRLSQSNVFHGHVRTTNHWQPLLGWGGTQAEFCLSLSDTRGIHLVYQRTPSNTPCDHRGTVWLKFLCPCTHGKQNLPEFSATDSCTSTTNLGNFEF